MSEFVEPSDKERQTALRGLTDAALVGHYWRLDDLDGLTEDERRRLREYRHETFGFEEYCEALVAGGDREPEDTAGLTSVLDRWEVAFLGLRCWQDGRSIVDGERNPVAKVLIYEESRITGMRGRLEPRLALVDQAGGSAARARPARVKTARVVRAAAAIERLAPERAPNGKGVPSRATSVGEEALGVNGRDAGALTEAILGLAEAVDRLTDVISRRPGSRTPPEPRSGGTPGMNTRAPHGI